MTTWIAGVETSKWRTRAVYDCLVAGQSPWAQAKPTAYRLYTHSVDDPKVPLQLQHAACGTI